jgi:hypothetical protein
MTPRTASATRLNNDAILLKHGHCMKKINRHGNMKACYVRMNAEETHLLRESKKNASKTEMIALLNVDRCIRGQVTRKFTKGSFKQLENRSMSICFGGSNTAQTLDLICESVSDRDTWVALVEGAVVRAQQQYDRARREDPELLYLKLLWQRADANHDNVLDLGEIKTCLKEIGHQVSNRALVQFFNEQDTDGSGGIDFEEFRAMLDKLRYRPEVEVLWNSLSKVR